ncbi:MAG: 4-alpha-glucanotransferase [Methyloceanibacter sp.]|uniref:4-alpha-glucanotransferase n=1 Tax=Methyloceanibacter sp. TaxID=1965321 RepID=UPI003D6D65BD
MPDRIDELAERFGIARGYISEAGDWVTTPPETKAKVLEAMGVPVGEAQAEHLPPPPPSDDVASLAASAFWPPFLVDQRSWGLSVQLYALRSARNWGIGDFEDLARLAEFAAGLGAEFIGVSPLHALFFADPSRISPYSPSTRDYLNPLLIAPDIVPGYADLPERASLEAELGALRDSALIHYPGVHRVKLRAFEALFAHFVKNAEPSAKEAFETYCREQGSALECHALYEALSERFMAEGRSVAWTSWPEEFRHPDNLAVRDFARAAKHRIVFHAWLQWIADAQLAEAQQRASAAGMRIGLYLDLAVGISPDGSRSWLDGPAIAHHARIGCPPDPFSASGQDWGLVPFSPVGLTEERFEPFRAVLRANMQHAGALRIDHAMGLQRLYWIPEDNTAKDGAYVAYPFRELLEGVAEESWISRTIVIGEDLGTVPPGFSDIIVRTGLLSYQVLYFSERNGAWMSPHVYRREALVCASTHDLPTLKGWWLGKDIDWRVKTGRATETEAAKQRHDRLHDRELLLNALVKAQAIEPDAAQAGDKEMSDEVLVAVHRFLALTPCRLLSVQLDDALGVVEQANLPGTIDEHPNWRRKTAVTIEALGDHPLFRAVVRAVAAERPR